MRLAPSLAFIVAGFLAACSESNSFTTGNPFTVFADPGEFEFYSCEQLLPQRNALVSPPIRPLSISPAACASRPPAAAVSSPMGSSRRSGRHERLAGL